MLLPLLKQIFTIAMGRLALNVLFLITQLLVLGLVLGDSLAPMCTLLLPFPLPCYCLLCLYLHLSLKLHLRHHKGISYCCSNWKH